MKNLFFTLMIYSMITASVEIAYITLYVTVGVQLQGKKKRLLIIRSSVDIMEIIVFSNCEFKITAGE